MGDLGVLPAQTGPADVNRDNEKKRFMINSNQILLLPRTIPRYYTVRSAFIIKIFVVQCVISGDAGLRD